MESAWKVLLDSLPRIQFVSQYFGCSQITRPLTSRRNNEAALASGHFPPAGFALVARADAPS
jgi:hypothetical protein